MNADYFILVGLIGDDFQVISKICSMQNRRVTHDTLPKVLTNPKRWRLRSDDKIVTWSEEFSEDEKESVDYHLLTKHNISAVRHKQWDTPEELRHIHNVFGQRLI